MTANEAKNERKVHKIIMFCNLLSECADSKMPATGNESVEMKQLKTEHKSQNSSKSSVSGFGRSAIDIASKKKGVLLKGVNQQSTILFDVDRHVSSAMCCICHEWAPSVVYLVYYLLIYKSSYDDCANNSQKIIKDRYCTWSTNTWIVFLPYTRTWLLRKCLW